jgi:hypothetical protein
VNKTPMDYRRALEALRSGVPNRDAVSVLGCEQPVIERKFRKQLADLTARKSSAGLLIAGSFGSGKSHLLEFLEHLALSENCVCSRVVISKETPLYDAGKVFAAAVENATVPGLSGRAIQEIAHILRPGSARYAEFYQWANQEGSGLSPMFPATLFLHERLNNDPELVADITNFWAGDKIGVGRIKQGLKQVEGAGLFQVAPVPMRDLPQQRFAFTSGLMRAAGFNGWVLLIDEVELIGRYSPLQRGKSYSEVARWAGRADSISGITSVLAITDDFALAVLEEKGDREKIVPKMREKHGSDSSLPESARMGMKIIDDEALPLAQPADSVLSFTYGRLKEIHSGAYGWEAPEASSADRTLKRPMRSYVRRWINEWDLARAYPGTHINVEEHELETTYAEDTNLEVAAEGDAE